jgi:hypothetical protein
MYIYHISTEKNLVKIKDNKFCAPQYFPRNFNLMHEKLKAMHETLPKGNALYRFCFYEDFNTTKKSLASDFSKWKSYIFRFKKQQFHDLGFNWQWDEGFDEGEAHLFWIEEDKTDNPWSNSGVPFNDIEVFDQGKWVTLDLFFSQLLTKLHLAPKQESESIEPKKIEINSEKGFFKKLANTLFKRDK